MPRSRRSSRRINEELPPERLMDTLARVDPFAALAGPPADVGPPDAAIARDPDVLAAGAQRRSRDRQRVRPRHRGLGLDRRATGSSSRMRTSSPAVDGLRVDRNDGAYSTAYVVSFDRSNDVAVLRVPGLERPRRCQWPRRRAGDVRWRCSATRATARSPRPPCASGATVLTSAATRTAASRSGGRVYYSRRRSAAATRAGRPWTRRAACSRPSSPSASATTGGYGVPNSAVRAALARRAARRSRRPASTLRLQPAAPAQPSSSSAASRLRNGATRRRRQRPRGDCARARARAAAPSSAASAPACSSASLHEVGDDDPRHLVVQPKRQLVAPQRPDADEQRDRRGAAEPLEEAVEVVEVEEDLRHREARACLELALEPLELELEVVGGRVHRDAEEERRRRVDRAAVEVLAPVQLRDELRQPDRVDLVDAARARVVAGLAAGRRSRRARCARPRRARRAAPTRARRGSCRAA